MHGRVKHNVGRLLLASILFGALVGSDGRVDLLALAERLSYDKVKTEEERNEVRKCASHLDQTEELMQEKLKMMRSLPH